MRFARGDTRGKTTTDLLSGTTEPCSGKNVQKSTFARFSEQFDFRLLQQYLPCVDGSELARTLFTLQTGRCSHVFGLLARSHDRWPQCPPRIGSRSKTRIRRCDGTSGLS